MHCLGVCEVSTFNFRIPVLIIDMAIVAALACASIACYWSVFTHGLINYDDETYLLEQPQVRQGLTWSNVIWAFNTYAVANWHPLTWLSYLLDASVFGLDDPGGFHVTNVIIHAINAALLYLVLRAMTGSRWRSALVAALFALHPLHVESVAWVSERKDVLSTMFGLLALISYVRYARTPAPWRYALVAAMFALALLAKPMLVTLPLVMWLLDYWPLNRMQRNQRGHVLTRSALVLLLEKAPLLAMSAASSRITVIAQHESGAVQDLRNLSLAQRLSNAVISYVMYLVDMVWPVNLVALRPLTKVQSAWWVAALAALIVISVLCLWQWRRRPYLIVGWLWYLGTLVPVIGLVQVGGQARADRYTYIPLIGVFMMLSWLIPDPSKSQRPRGRGRGRAPVIALAAIAGMALVVLGAITIKQCGIWKDSATFWDANIERGVQSTFAYNNRGNDHLRAERFAEAEADFRKAIELDPGHAEAHFNLGVLMGQLDREDEALALYARAAQIKPDLASAHYNAGNIYKRRREFQSAVEHYNAALAGRPEYAEAHTNLAGALHHLNRLEEAEAHYREALRLNRRIIIAYDGLGRVLITLRRRDEGLAVLREGLDIDPNYEPIRALLHQLDTQLPTLEEVPNPFLNPPAQTQPHE
jgi:tetratricopeptide (TPR) repeat protein